jgi:hypothetical protein
MPAVTPLISRSAATQTKRAPDERRKHLPHRITPPDIYQRDERVSLTQNRPALVGTFVVPKPMLAAVGEDDERRLQVLRIAPSLLLGVIGIKVFALGLEHGQNAPKAIFQEVVGSPARCVELKLYLLRIEQIPAAALLVAGDAIIGHKRGRA